MSAPGCINARDRSFVVVTDKEKLNRMADANDLPATALKKTHGRSSCAKIWSQMVIEKQRELFHLLDSNVPDSVLTFGFPAKEIGKTRESHFEKNRVTWNENEW